MTFISGKKKQKRPIPFSNNNNNNNNRFLQLQPLNHKSPIEAQRKKEPLGAKDPKQQ